MERLHTKFYTPNVYCVEAIVCLPRGWYFYVENVWYLHADGHCAPNMRDAYDFDGATLFCNIQRGGVLIVMSGTYVVLEYSPMLSLGCVVFVPKKWGGINVDICYALGMRCGYVWTMYHCSVVY